MELQRSTCIYMYERMLLGHSKKQLTRLATTFSDDDPSIALKYGEVIIGHIWNYVVTEMLEWTPQQAVLYMNDDIVRLLALDRTLPLLGIKRRSEMYMPDYRFVLQHAFPGIIRYGDDEWAIDIFKRCAHIEEYRRSKKKFEYPKNFWADMVGYNRALLMFSYILDHYYGDMSPIELYDYFADAKKGTSILKKYALYVPLRQHFINPLEFLHETLRKKEMEEEDYYRKLAGIGN